MLMRSMVSTSTAAMAHATAFARISSSNSLRFFSESCLESVRPVKAAARGRMTAGATTGPNIGPRPTSSRPAMHGADLTAASFHRSPGQWHTCRLRPCSAAFLQLTKPHDGGAWPCVQYKPTSAKTGGRIGAGALTAQRRTPGRMGRGSVIWKCGDGNGGSNRLRPGLCRSRDPLPSGGQPCRAVRECRTAWRGAPCSCESFRSCRSPWN